MLIVIIIYDEYDDNFNDPSIINSKMILRTVIILINFHVNTTYLLLIKF